MPFEPERTQDLAILPHLGRLANTLKAAVSEPTSRAHDAMRKNDGLIPTRGFARRHLRFRNAHFFVHDPERMERILDAIDDELDRRGMVSVHCGTAVEQPATVVGRSLKGHGVLAPGVRKRALAAVRPDTAVAILLPLRLGRSLQRRRKPRASRAFYRGRGVGYAAAIRAWEPLPEAAAALRAIVLSIPR
jgi:hypothetical protein